MHIIYMLTQLAPCLSLGYILGRLNEGLALKITRPLIRYGIPTSLMGLLLRAGIGINLIKSAAMALLSIGLLIAVITLNPQLKSKVSSTTLKLGSSFGNTGYFGIPVALALLPEEALSFSIGFDLAATLVIWGLAPGLITPNQKELKQGQIASYCTKRISNSPAIKGLVGALIISTTPWAQEVASILWIPSKIVIYLALIVVGIKFTSLGRSTTSSPIKNQLHGIKSSLIIKLIGLPTLMLTLCLILKTPELMRNALVLQAAAPTAISVLLIEQNNYCNKDEATVLLAYSTLISFITIPSWAMVLNI